MNIDVKTAIATEHSTEVNSLLSQNPFAEKEASRFKGIQY